MGVRRVRRFESVTKMCGLSLFSGIEIDFNLDGRRSSHTSDAERGRRMEHRLGIIGAGGIAREVHVPVLRTFSDVKIVAVADADRAAAERLAGVHGIPYVMTDYRELLARSDVDVVLISTPNHLHAEMAVAALEAGKHVLLEKPMATCAAEAERIAAKARECGRILMVGMNNRFRPDAQQLKRYLEGGAFGDVYHVRTGWLRRAGIPSWSRWFTDKARAGGGVLLDIGVHMLDLALWLLGNPRVVLVTGKTFQTFTRPEARQTRMWAPAASDGAYDVEDFAVAFLHLETGATLTLEVSWAANLARDVQFVHLFGTGAGAVLEEIDFSDRRFTVYTERFGCLVDESPRVKWEPWGDRVAMWRHFLDCVKTGQPPSAAVEEAVQVQRILDAIYTASETGQPVALG